MGEPVSSYRYIIVYLLDVSDMILVPSRTKSFVAEPVIPVLIPSALIII